MKLNIVFLQYVSFVKEDGIYFGIFSNSKLIGLNCTFSPHIEFTNRLEAEDSKPDMHSEHALLFYLAHSCLHLVCKKKHSPCNRANTVVHLLHVFMNLSVLMKIVENGIFKF